MQSTIPQIWEVQTVIDEMKELLMDESAIPEIDKFIKLGQSAFVIKETRLGVAEYAGNSLLLTSSPMG